MHREKNTRGGYCRLAHEKRLIGAACPCKSCNLRCNRRSFCRVALCSQRISQIQLEFSVEWCTQNQACPILKISSTSCEPILHGCLFVLIISARLHLYLLRCTVNHHRPCHVIGLFYLQQANIVMSWKITTFEYGFGTVWTIRIAL